MRNKTIACIASCCVFGGLFSGFVAADYGGGGGWAESPFLISEPAHLMAIAGNPDHWGETIHFKLVADIDMDGHVWTAAHFIGQSNATGGTFRGTFDGNHHVIRNLSYSAASGGAGLFGFTSGATIKNLGLENVTISVDSAVSVGSLISSVVIGHSTMPTRVENCYSLYTITTGNSATAVGGLIGSASGVDIDNCYSRGTITAGTQSTRIGGLVGGLSGHPSYPVTVTNSYSAGAIVTGNNSQMIGGLAGACTHLSNLIDNCYSTCSVNANVSTSIGGLVGRHTEGTIANSFATGAVNGSTQVGGLAGIADNSTISHSYSTSDINGFKQVGGLVGMATQQTSIAASYTAGTITAPASAGNVGGLVGWLNNLGSITDSYSASSVTCGLNASGVGGLVGMSDNSAVRRCTSSGTVSVQDGPFGVGGLIGFQGGGVTENSYSLSDVYGGTQARAGGLVGTFDGGTIADCFSAGAVVTAGANAGGLIGQMQSGGVFTSFWDTDTSGQPTSDGGAGVKGLPTSAMQTQTAFTSAGWDFDDVWMMFDYPGLTWQPEIGVSGDFSSDVSVGEGALIDFYVFGLRNATIDWTLDGYGNCDWIAQAAPVEGVSTGPDDATLVQLTVDATGLETGDHLCQLSLTANDKTLTVPIHLHVYQRVNLEKFVLLAAHWATDACDFGQPCKAADWYVDGVIDLLDLMQLADGWLGAGIEKIRATIEENFDTGVFSAMDWQHRGDADWTIVDSGAYEGTYAARSGTIDDLQTTTLEVTLDLTGWEVNTIGFAVKTSSEDGWDVLRFYIDGVEHGFGWSGQMFDYVYSTFAVTPGVRTFTWTYSKDFSGAAGQDCAWIDNIRIYAQ